MKYNISGSRTLTPDGATPVRNICIILNRCGTALHLLSVLASEVGITIDRAIGAPAHGKDIVDGLNATDKIFLRKMFCMIGTPEANDGACRMAAHAMVGVEKMSLAVESARLCSLPTRESGVKAEGGKRQKREAEAKMKSRVYHVQDPAMVKHKKINMSAAGFEKGDHNGLLAHYHFRVSKDLGVGKAAAQHIPCACAPCMAQLELPWVVRVKAADQPCYASSSGCIYWPNFKMGVGEPGINDWKILSLEPKKQSDPEEEEEARAEALAGMTEMMAELIKVGGQGAFSTLDENAAGYYVVDWMSEPYTLQDDVELAEYTPAMWLKAGELVCDARYYHEVVGAKGWYTPMEASEQRDTVVRVQQVVAADLRLKPIAADNKLPSGMNKRKKELASKLGAVRLLNADHEKMLDEICRREELEHDEGEESSEDESSDEEEEDGSEEEV